MDTLTESAFERALAMFEDRSLEIRHIEARVAVFLVSGKRWSAEEDDFLCENCVIARRCDILACNIGQPEQIVRTARSYATVCRRMPPMQDVAFFKLVRGRLENVLPGATGIAMQEGQHVLQLITEAERAPRLIETCTG